MNDGGIALFSFPVSNQTKRLSEYLGIFKSDTDYSVKI